MKQHKLVALAGMAALMGAVPALAHHSAAMFDMEKTMTISGTVKEWQFMNPHSWLQVVSMDPQGKEEQWSFEGASPAGGGTSPNAQLHKDTFKPGDKVTVETHPMKDGRHAGILGTVTFADGHKWIARGPGGPPPPRGPGGAAPGAPPGAGTPPPPPGT